MLEQGAPSYFEIYDIPRIVNIFLSNQEYVIYLFFILIIAGLLKKHDVLVPVYSFFLDKCKSSRLFLFLTSSTLGVLPIPGRVRVSAALLDSIPTSSTENRKKLGIIDYVSTHHYYFWSPLEKTVILPMAVLSLTYTGFFELIWPMLLITFVYIYWVINNLADNNFIAIQNNAQPVKLSYITRYLMPLMLGIAGIIAGIDKMVCMGFLAFYYTIVTVEKDILSVIKKINWGLLASVMLIIVIGNFFKSYTDEVKQFIEGYATQTQAITAVALFGFFGSFALGSSSRFAAICVLSASIFGIEWLPLFFAIDFAGYLISPVHKCTIIGKMYFGTNVLEYYKYLIVWALLVVATGGITTYTML